MRTRSHDAQANMTLQDYLKNYDKRNGCDSVEEPASGVDGADDAAGSSAPGSVWVECCNMACQK